MNINRRGRTGLWSSWLRQGFLLSVQVVSGGKRATTFSYNCAKVNDGVSESVGLNFVTLVDFLKY